MNYSYQKGKQEYGSPNEQNLNMLNTEQSQRGGFRDRPLSAATSLKMTKSNEFFRTTKVDSCSYVVIKNGVAQAIPFRPKPKPDDYVPLEKESEYQYLLHYYAENNDSFRIQEVI